MIPHHCNISSWFIVCTSFSLFLLWQVRRHIQESIRNRFDSVTIPRNITINDLCLSYVINLVSHFVILNLKSCGSIIKSLSASIITDARIDSCNTEGDRSFVPDNQDIMVLQNNLHLSKRAL